MEELVKQYKNMIAEALKENNSVDDLEYIYCLIMECNMSNKKKG